MSATVGKVQEFNPESDKITAYWERHQFYFLANDIPEAKQVPTLVSVNT